MVREAIVKARCWSATWVNGRCWSATCVSADDADELVLHVLVLHDLSTILFRSYPVIVVCISIYAVCRPRIVSPPIEIFLLPECARHAPSISVHDSSHCSIVSMIMHVRMTRCMITTTPFAGRQTRTRCSFQDVISLHGREALSFHRVS